MGKRKSPANQKRLGNILHSIRFRLVLWFTAILAVILSAFSAFLFYTQSYNIQQEAVQEMNRRVTSLSESVQSALYQASGEITIPNGILRDSDIFILLSPTGQIMASHGSVPAQEAIQVVSTVLQTTLRTNQPTAMYWTSPDSESYLFLVTPVPGPLGISFPMIFGGILDPSALIRRFLLTLITGSLLTLAIALGGGFWLADRAMRPVKTITQTARSISETDLSRRLNMKSKDELGELASTFDAMLVRLQGAFERQRQFVADASHELRTPLTIVNLETSRAIESPRTSQEYRKALNIIHCENDFMTSLVNDLLTLARMDAGQTVIKKMPVDLSDVAVETIERLTPLANRKQVTLKAGDLPETVVAGDRQLLLQMLSNLVENAIKYSSGKDNWVKIEIGTEEGSAWIRVSDNGSGIAAEHLPHLFDRFYRVDQARTREVATETNPEPPNGSGLGLSIVQWIARAHGGEVQVESSPDIGSAFEIRFKVG